MNYEVLDDVKHKLPLWPVRHCQLGNRNFLTTSFKTYLFHKFFPFDGRCPPKCFVDSPAVFRISDAHCFLVLFVSFC